MQHIPESLGGGYVIKYSTAVWVGYIALFGVAVEDGIVFIEYLLERVRGGERVDKAVVNAGLLRVRPIVMTTATTVLALLPIMLAEVSTTTGAELMKPIAVPTFGGMVSATAANLFLAPVLFSLFYPLEEWFSRRGGNASTDDDPNADDDTPQAADDDAFQPEAPPSDEPRQPAADARDVADEDGGATGSEETAAPNSNAHDENDVDEDSEEENHDR